MASSNRRRAFVGATLIVLGLALFLLQRFEGLGVEALFLVIGGVFFAAYLAQREYGFLIPGCILLGLGGGVFADRMMRGGQPEMLGLGLGFVAIFVVGWLIERRTDWWPLIPGGILIVLALGFSRDLLEYLLDNWPLILVLVGLLILFGAWRDGGRALRGGDSGQSRPDK